VSNNASNSRKSVSSFTEGLAMAGDEVERAIQPFLTAQLTQFGEICAPCRLM
jgi:hypothetical protein